MEKQNLNLMIFDDDEEPAAKNDLKKYTSQSKNIKPSLVNGHNSEKNIKNSFENDKMFTISKQINELKFKIKNLEKDGNQIRIELQKRNGSCYPNPSSTAQTSNKTKQIEQILMIVEKKIQLIIHQSKKLITKMNETVDKKLIQLQKEQQHQKPKIEPTNEKNKIKLNQIQFTMRNKLQQYEIYYRNEYEKLVKQTKRKEESMIKKLSQIELNFANKLNSFENKEKQYVNWIHHLEAKLKERKSKKMITITQEKPQLSPIHSKANIQSTENFLNQNQHNLENFPATNFQTSKVNCSIDQNNSKVIRKHKIFGGKSTSPAPRNDNVVSPTKDSVMPKKVSNNLPNQSSGSSFNQQNSRGGPSNLNFYSDLKRQDTDRYRQSLKQQNDGGWDKFADLNDFNEEYTETESDDFFTPIDQQESNANYERVLANIPVDSRGGTYYGQPFRSQRSYENDNIGLADRCEKVFSPFDLN